MKNHENMKEMKLVAMSKIFSGGQTQIPKDIRDKLNIKDGDKIVWYEKNGDIIVKKA